MSAAKTKAQAIIDDNPIGKIVLTSKLHRDALTLYSAVFSKSYCPYCRATKALLSNMGAKYYAIELDQVGMFALVLLSG
jgi:glutaredoxin 3